MRFITLSILPFIRSLLPIQTEKNITLSAYTGLWYQVATSRSTALLGTGIDYTNVSALYNITNTSKYKDEALSIYFRMILKKRVYKINNVIRFSFHLH